MTRYLLLGSDGMLGHDLAEALGGRQVSRPGSSELDIRDLDALRAAVKGHDVVINAAAFTDVDGAESATELVFEVNATGAGNTATAARENGAWLIHLSTDYVFDGSARAPYAETAELSPINAYGRSKAEGERLVTRGSHGEAVILRTAWLYGRSGRSFPATILRKARAGGSVAVVDDQFGQPTWSADLARRIVQLSELPPTGGVFHATNSGQTSRYELARSVLEAAGIDPAILVKQTSSTLTTIALRPRYSVLGHGAWDSIGIPPMRDWRDALAQAVAEGVLDEA